MNKTPQNVNADRQTMNGKPVLWVPAKSVLNLDSGFKHKLLCDGPTFSPGSACAYRCSFCYVPGLMRKSPHLVGVKQKHEDVVIRRAGAVEALRRQLTDAKGRPKFGDPTDRRVVYASPLVDVAANMELVRETIECCKVILELTAWDIRLLSKSSLLPKIAQALVKEGSPHTEHWPYPWISDIKQRLIFGVSTGTLDDDLAAAFEQGTAKVSKRLESLHWLQDNGFRTFGMICPSLPCNDYVGWALAMAEAIRWKKCEHVWAEVMNVRGESMTRTVDCLTRAGHPSLARRVLRMSQDKWEWEEYAQETFLAHAQVYEGRFGADGGHLLRFLQYVSKDSKPWWEERINRGAILL